ncbi:dipeptidyl peptidase 3 [Phocaeicola barnesiae]|uniref:Dipeptidyl peptidase 3 n=1 Tax=Phocaeicola barnesiae TaxID=376804 RepID=A0AAW5N4S0_9BACT|nr:dipeptidyl peptidase 3 [Phocaeicola barnesiae]MCF2599496.1 dihydrofolate reductase [Phocaeicola barnesiae]MCR8873037.1 dipeptidyl peptidase 3 [Phocaeicola barnesiae]MDM8233535.1 dipeptidyl peptidase 3 [Phocaeicola barnesiae]MDM8242660.1 dipeptidyl peptidase 3 [Phocaeicola barnesiae]MDM8251761.1 dipeptidyl peptidase 3 [Phocaeicola barnesiae]
MRKEEHIFNYVVDQFADLQVLRYRVAGFDSLTLQQKKLVYYLSEAALQGRDILFDQNGKYNLQIRRLLETLYVHFTGDRTEEPFLALEVYLKRVWFSNGIHHHYGCDKFVPGFSAEYLKNLILHTDVSLLPLESGETVEAMCDKLFPVIFHPEVMPKRVNQNDGEDLVETSAANYYEGVTQQEAEAFYAAQKAQGDAEHPVMYGMNSRLVKKDGVIQEEVWKVGGLYGKAIEKIIGWLHRAEEVAENDSQRQVIRLLVAFYQTGDLKLFDDYSIQWLKDTASRVDFVNGFIESYGDPLGMKASWESIVNFKDLEATRRTELISSNAQWFEDHSPVNPSFKKERVKGVSAKVITAAMLAGDLYPSSAIGINLPNSNWIRSVHGSKSVTIGNLTDAYNKAARGNGFREEFVYSEAEKELLDNYADLTSDLHTDLHECLGHGSGKLLPGVDPDALKAYGSTIEEARADLFGLYYMADAKLVELGLLPDNEAYKAEYYSYMMNGLMTQLVRIEPGAQIEEAHMRNRQLIARWALEKGRDGQVVEWVKKAGKTFVRINDYVRLRELFGQLLAEIQRIKSEGDFEAARALVENYAVKVDAALHAEVLERYSSLHLAPYKGFVNPVYTPQVDENGEITDVTVLYDEGYTEQMLRYSRDYSNL